jgi:3-hydroxyisobutyrate dehydrogenase-like beta-hydroxyacid dehydrogenase
LQPVGFIGLGNMGAHMANNLMKNGYPLIVNDVNETATSKLTAGGDFKFVKTPREVASLADQIITMLPSSPHVQQVYGSGSCQN